MKKSIIVPVLWLLIISCYVFAETDTCLTQNYLYPGGSGKSNIKLDSYYVPNTIYPGDTVTGKIKWSFTQMESSWNSNALVWGNIYPSWNPSSSISTLYSGTVGSQRDLEKTFSFQAPSNPGNYDLRVTFIFGMHQIYSYYCRNIDCPECGAIWTSIPITVSTPQPTTYCGDGSCNGNEDCKSCVSDCGPCCSDECTLNDRRCHNSNAQICSRDSETGCTEWVLSESCSSNGGICCNNLCVQVCESNYDCNDGNTCTKDTCANPSTCSAACVNVQITKCINSDGCCPSGCNSNNDNDCKSKCGNGLCESGEDCSTCSLDCGTCGCKQDYQLIGTQRIDNFKVLSYDIPDQVEPGKLVSGKIRWEFVQTSGYNPSALTYVNLYGNWKPNSELGMLYSGVIGSPREVEKSFSFMAPSVEGVYDIRFMFIFGKHAINSYDCGNIDCPSCGAIWSSVPITVKRKVEQTNTQTKTTVTQTEILSNPVTGLITSVTSPSVSTCGDGICGSNENEASCPDDCGESEDINEDITIDFFNRDVEGLYRFQTNEVLEGVNIVTDKVTALFPVDYADFATQLTKIVFHQLSCLSEKEVYLVNLYVRSLTLPYRVKSNKDNGDSENIYVQPVDFGLATLIVYDKEAIRDPNVYLNCMADYIIDEYGRAVKVGILFPENDLTICTWDYDDKFKIIMATTNDRIRSKFCEDNSHIYNCPDMFDEEHCDRYHINDMGIVTVWGDKITEEEGDLITGRYVEEVEKSDNLFENIKKTIASWKLYRSAKETFCSWGFC
jgi:hypothetical protein